MSDKSKKFWQDQISRKGEIVVPDLLDDWAKVVTQDLRDESDRYFAELQASTAANTDLAAILKEQVEENARMVDEIREMGPYMPYSHPLHRALVAGNPKADANSVHSVCKAPQACSNCSGSGWTVQFMTQCGYCNGTGTTIDSMRIIP